MIEPFTQLPKDRNKVSAGSLNSTGVWKIGAMRLSKMSSKADHTCVGFSPWTQPCQTLSAGNLHTWQVWTTANPVKPWHHQGTSSSPFSTLHFRLRKRSANSFSWQRVSEKFEALSSSNCIMAGVAMGESLKSKSVCCLLAMQQAVKWGAGSRKTIVVVCGWTPFFRPSINLSVNQSINQTTEQSVDQWIYGSVDLAVCWSVGLSIGWSVDILIHISIYRSAEPSIAVRKWYTDLSIYRSVDILIHWSIYLSIYLSIHPSIYLSNPIWYNLIYLQHAVTHIVYSVYIIIDKHVYDMHSLILLGVGCMVPGSSM